MDADAETDGDKGSSKYMFRFLKRKVGDGGVRGGGGAPLTNMTECGECQGENEKWMVAAVGPLCQGEQPFPVDLNLHFDL